MSRLIDADGLKRQALFGITNDGIGMHVVTIEQIDAQPTIEAEPVRHGHWEEDKNYNAALQRCSVCKRLIYYGCLMNYCPHCGAKMDEVSE